MDLFSKAKVVRLRSHHDKYLTANSDDSVVQQQGACNNTTKPSIRSNWAVELVTPESNCIRLKSCYDRYLATSTKPYLLGLTGHKVIQHCINPAETPSSSSIEWEPIREGMVVKLKTRCGNFLRANGGTYPYKNSITHDTPHRSITKDWILWDLEVVDLLISTRPPSNPSWRRIARNDQTSLSSKKPNEREIFYHIADNNEEEGNYSECCSCFLFEGWNVEELTRKLEEETQIEGITVCTRDVVSAKLYPLCLRLPPNNAALNVVVVPPSPEGYKFVIYICFDYRSNVNGWLFVVLAVAKGFADLGLI